MTGKAVPATDTVFAVSLEGVSKSFDQGQHLATRDVDLSIAPGRFVAMVALSR